VAAPLLQRLSQKGKVTVIALENGINRIFVSGFGQVRLGVVMENAQPNISIVALFSMNAIKSSALLSRN
jgi:hypothetical protein